MTIGGSTSTKHACELFKFCLKNKSEEEVINEIHKQHANTISEMAMNHLAYGHVTAKYARREAEKFYDEEPSSLGIILIEIEKKAQTGETGIYWPYKITRRDNQELEKRGFKIRTQTQNGAATIIW